MKISKCLRFFPVVLLASFAFSCAQGAGAGGGDDTEDAGAVAVGQWVQCSLSAAVTGMGAATDMTDFDVKVATSGTYIVEFDRVPASFDADDFIWQGNRVDGLDYLSGSGQHAVDAKEIPAGTYEVYIRNDADVAVSFRARLVALDDSGVPIPWEGSADDPVGLTPGIAHNGKTADYLDGVDSYYAITCPTAGTWTVTVSVPLGSCVAANVYPNANFSGAALWSSMTLIAGGGSAPDTQSHTFTADSANQTFGILVTDWMSSSEYPTFTITVSGP